MNYSLSILTSVNICVVCLIFSNFVGAEQFKDISILNVKSFGALGDGKNDDTKLINRAIEYSITSGSSLYFPSGIYIISSPISAKSNIHMCGSSSESYIDFRNDWEKEIPSYAKSSTIIQYMKGHHGPIIKFESANSCSFSGITFRCGQSRSELDVFTSDTTDFFRFDDCKFENLDSIFSSSSTPYGGGTVHACRFIGGNRSFTGTFVDTIFNSCVFTSVVGQVFSFTTGSGFINIVGNRFEFCGTAIKFYKSRPSVITGNVFDSCSSAAIEFRNQEGSSVTGNIFWRNGTINSESNSSHINIIGKCEGISIQGNQFLAGSPDIGGRESPKYCIEFANSAGSNVCLRGNNLCLGYTEFPIGDQKGNSILSLDSDVIQLRKEVGNPNEANDNLSSLLLTLNHCLTRDCIVDIYENRKMISDGAAEKVILVGIGNEPIKIDSILGCIRCASASNIIYGKNLYTIISGKMFTSTFDGSKANGIWPIGTIIYNSDVTRAPRAWEICDLSLPQSTLPFRTP